MESRARFPPLRPFLTRVAAPCTPADLSAHENKLIKVEGTPSLSSSVRNCSRGGRAGSGELGDRPRWEPAHHPCGDPEVQEILTRGSNALQGALGAAQLDFQTLLHWKSPTRGFLSFPAAAERGCSEFPRAHPALLAPPRVQPSPPGARGPGADESGNN